MSSDSPGPPERPVALAATEGAVTLRLAEIDDDRIPSDLTCLGSFLGDRLVARCVVPPDAAHFLLEQRLFERPVRLALAAREEAPGLQCRLFALVDLPPEFPEGDLDEEPDEPWAASVPGAGYERVVRGGGGGEDQDDESDDEDQTDEDAERQAAVFLGQIVRFDRDRKHKDSLALETVDVLRTIVAGDVREVVDRVLEDLLGGSERE